MLEVEVTYADGSKQRAGMTARGLDGLTKTGVLFIALSTEWGNRAALVARLWARRNTKNSPAWHGRDHYTIGLNDAGEFFAHAWDDRTFRIRPLATPDTDHQREVEVEPATPPGFKVWHFEGEQVAADVWERALADFEKDGF